MLDKEKAELLNTYQGVLDFHSETGTEGGYWAFMDQRFITPPNVESSYEQW